MSKRSRISDEDARRAGLNAWETPEGRKWLMKALNPNDTTVPTCGIPTLQSRNISVLNWQAEYSVDAPENITSTIPSYDSTLFLYHHPLIFGLSATHPSGCMDMREFDGFFKIENEAAEGGGYIYHLKSAKEPSMPIAQTRCSRFLNKQIDPSVFKGDKSLAGRRKLLEQLTQRNRIIYGGVTLIPTCSNQYNSGSMAVSQSIFNPRRTTLPKDNNVELWTYLNNDFPDTSDTVQNPQMYYGRFQDGAYIPYKMNEPASTPYINSEQQITTRSPYYVTGVSFIGNISEAVAPATTIELEEVEGEWSAVTKKQLDIKSTKPMYGCVGIRLYITLFTGQEATMTITLADQKVTQSNIVFSSEDLSNGVTTVSGDPTTIHEDVIIEQASATAIELDNKYIKLPESFTAWQWNTDTELLGNPLGTAFLSEDISEDPNASADLKVGTICPYNGSSIITVHMSGVSNTAPIKMLLRYGTEILLVASSPYSPFKFMSPRYDESAIKSYARCIRNMKDAYFANAGSIPGQLDYTNKLMTLIENDSAEDLNRTLNQGGTWYGVV